MSNATRTGRRRRLLQEGISAQSPAPDQASLKSSEARATRYAPRAESVSFALAAALPRGHMMLFLAGLLAFTPPMLILAIEWLGSQAASSHTAGLWLPPVDSPAAHAGGIASVASWCCSTGWLVLGMGAMLAFGLRRRRMDDLRGGYRWWVVAAASALMMSLNAATHLHDELAALAATQFGRPPILGEAIWWLAPAFLLLGGLGVRLLLDLYESRLAFASASLACLAIVYGWLLSASVVPAPAVEWASAPSLAIALVSLGQAFACFSLMVYARSVAVETAAESEPASDSAQRRTIEAPARKPRATEGRSARGAADELAKRKAAAKPVSQPAVVEEDEARRPPARKAREEVSEATEPSTTWTDGADAHYQDEYEDQPKNRRMSKAERKRLRKQKARRAA